MRNRAPGGPPRSDRDRLRSRRPRFDKLEDRRLLAAHPVTTTNDAGAGSFRQAIIDANLDATTPDIITFQLSGNGFQTFAPSAPYPSLDRTITVDGYSQPASVQNSLTAGSNASPLIQLIGSNLPIGSRTGLVINSPGVVIDGLILNLFDSFAITDTNLAGGAQIWGNFVGTDETGTVAAGNGTGIFLQTSNNTVGGLAPADHNVISGNITGLDIAANSTSNASNNLVAGNFIGTTFTGTGAAPNNTGAILESKGTGVETKNTFGGTTTSALNAFDSNLSWGLRIMGAGSTGNLVAGNFVGVAASGGLPLANNTGIDISSPGNTIGGPSAAFRNVISGNTGIGLQIDTAFPSVPGNLVQGNFIGVNIAGTAAQQNLVGLEVLGSANNTIGGTVAGAANVLSGNLQFGLVVIGSAQGNLIVGNRIGTDPLGTTALPNGTGGVELGGQNNTVGGIGAALNVISGNAGQGVFFHDVTGAPSGDLVSGNDIGVDSTGKKALPNTADGVFLTGTSNTIGGTQAGMGNVISGNGGNGILAGRTIDGVLQPLNDVIVGNLIGVDVTGSATLPNTLAGVSAPLGSGLTIGSIGSGPKNVISGNAGGGIVLGAGSTNTLIQGNIIGLDPTGSGALSSGSAMSGVTITNSRGNTIGGTVSGAGNVISGNGGAGVSISGTSSGKDLIAGNMIGTNAAGTVAVPNGSFGVALAGASSTVGGTVLGARNVISGNKLNGLFIGSSPASATSGNLVEGNLIGTDTTGTKAIPNVGGIVVNGASNTTIGGTSAVALNVISGNGAEGVQIAQSNGTTTGNLVAGNFIGVDVTGEAILPNSGVGVLTSAPGTTIGGPTASFRNVISANASFGVQILPGATSSVVSGNYIGLDAAGTGALGNVLGGVDVGEFGATVGGVAGNVIPARGEAAITIESTGGSALITGNFLGTAADGVTELAGVGSGVVVNGASGVQIGDGTAAGSNVIGGFATDGVRLTGSGNTATSIEDNAIGTDLSGTLNLGNGVWGISIEGPSGVTIGGTSAALGNLIENNGPTTANGLTGGGVGIRSGTQDEVLTNTIFNNNGLGIDLAEDGVPTSGPGGTTGPNNLLGFPVLILASPGLTTTIIKGTLTDQAGTYTIQFFSNVAADPSGFGEGQTFIGELDDVFPGSFTAVLPTLVPIGQFVTAVVTDAAGNTSEFSPDLRGVPSADLSITVTSSPNPVVIGQTLTYTLTVTNLGPTDAPNVVATDTLPASVQYVSASSVPLGLPILDNGSLVTANIGAIAAGGTVTITITTTVLPTAVTSPSVTGLITDTANVALVPSSPPNIGDPVDPVTANNTSSTTTTVDALTDLVVAVTASPSPGTQLSPLTYIVTVTDDGPNDATNVTAIDTLPAGVTFVSAVTSTGQHLTPSGGALTAIFSTLANGAAVTITIVVIPTASGDIVDNATATAFAPQFDPGSPNLFTLHTTINPVATLSATLTGSPANVFVGQPLTYTLTVTNSGPSTATGIVATDTLPPGVTFVSATPGPGQGTALPPSNGVLTIDFNAIPSGGTATATIIVTPTTSAAATPTDDVILTADDAATVVTSPVTTTVTPIAALSLSLTGTAGPLPVGADITYALTVSNSGPSDAAGVVVTDTLPVGVTYVSSTPGAGGSVGQQNGVVTATFATIPAGQSGTFTILAATTAAAVPSVTNSATATSQTSDSNGTTITSQPVTTQVSPLVNLSLDVHPSATAVLIGFDVTYTFTVQNNGPSTATNVTVTDTLPAGSLFAGTSFPTPPPIVDGVATFSLGSIPIGGSQTFQLSVRPTTLGTAHNVASIASTETNSNAENSSVTTDVQVSTSSDVSVSLAALPPTVLLGQPLTYTANVVNHGPSPSTGVTFTALLPSGLPISSVVTTAGTVSVSGETVTVNIGNLADTGLVTITIVAVPSLLGIVSTEAEVNADNLNVGSGDNIATSNVSVLAAADLAIIQGVSANPAKLNANLVYTLDVTNNGPSTATNVVLTDVLPAGATFVSASSSTGATFSPVGQVLTTPLGDLGRGQGIILTITVVPTLSGTLNNTASVSADQTDTDAANSTGVQLLTVAGIPGVLQFASPAFSAQENAGTATITVTRLNGSDGPVSVNVATSDGTGMAGTNYVATNATLFFASGQTSQTFSVPLIDDNKNDGDKTVVLTLSNPSGGASLGGSSTAVLTLVNTDTNPIVPVDQTAPEVTQLLRYGFHTQPTELVLTFSGPMLASSATNGANYTVTAPDGTIIPVATATYDQTSSAVTLLMAGHIDVHFTYHIVVNGSAGGLTGTNGLLLDGDGNHQPGGNYTAPIDFGTLAGPLNVAKTKKASHHKVAARLASHAMGHVKAKWADHLTHRKVGK